MPMITPIEGPCYAIQMPLKADGQGPEMNIDKVVAVAWPVWDQVCNEICVCKYQGDAELIARLLNAENGQ